ncbi:MAG: tRNA (adenosine(37)-N6)-dimethylallyltransferase MiaA [Ruminiclostridium sp.]|nr:tRNA (adenosine(37)-N6)-dimethylallyltransferase MiaA [Ruminiclostridium sp.]
MDKIFVAVVCGPTASGKTALAVDLALKFGGEIVSADSMQIYKGMDIASAKPTEEEKKGVPHHIMDFLEPTEAFSVADYVEMARKVIADIHARGKLPVICGGTGLYINSLIDNIEFDDTGSDPGFRAEMNALAAEKGNGHLLGMLAKVDPECAAQLHENNLKRIIRALEVYHISGKTMSEQKAASRLNPSPYEPCMMMIDHPREVLYERIDSRVDVMLEAGLIEEAREFFTHNDYVTASQAIGYKELRPYIDGVLPLEECVETLKRETRRYAKRQLTWFKKDSRIEHISAPKDVKYDKILKNAENLIKKYSFFIKDVL